MKGLRGVRRREQALADEEDCEERKIESRNGDDTNLKLIAAATVFDT